jgi:hypothetical protein
METTTVDQIINSSGLILAPVLTILLGYFLANKLIKRKSKVEVEIELLKSILFFRGVIEKYKSLIIETGKDGKSLYTTNQYNKCRNEVQKELDYEPNYLSKPSEIRTRLARLGALSKELEKLIQKIPIK